MIVVELGETEQSCAHVFTLGCGDFLKDGESTAESGLGSSKVVLIAERHAEFVEGKADVTIVGTKRCLSHLDGLLRKGNGLGDSSLLPQLLHLLAHLNPAGFLG